MVTGIKIPGQGSYICSRKMISRKYPTMFIYLKSHFWYVICTKSQLKRGFSVKRIHSVKPTEQDRAGFHFFFSVKRNFGTDVGIK